MRARMPRAWLLTRGLQRMPIRPGVHACRHFRPPLFQRSQQFEAWRHVITQQFLPLRPEPVPRAKFWARCAAERSIRCRSLECARVARWCIAPVARFRSPHPTPCLSTCTSAGSSALAMRWRRTSNVAGRPVLRRRPSALPPCTAKNPCITWSSRFPWIGCASFCGGQSSPLEQWYRARAALPRCCLTT